MNALSICLFVLLAVGATSLFRTTGRITYALIFYLFINLFVIHTGYIVSFFGGFSQLAHWMAVEIIALALLAFLLFRFKIKPHLPDLHTFNFSLSLNLFEKCLLGLLASTVCGILVLNLIAILFAAPHNADSLTYHLARVAFYLQHGTMDWYPANQWPQVVHPKNSASTFGYIFLISNYTENLTQFPQFVAYIVTLLAVYGISTQLHLSKTNALISSLLAGLPICLILGSTTNQNDLLITSFTGCSVYFLLCYKNSPDYKYLILFAISTAVMTGYKASAIMVYPVLGITALFSLHDTVHGFRVKRMLALGAFCVLASIILTLPAGFWENYCLYGHPIGPSDMRTEHNFEGLPISQIVYSGFKNVFRYLANFCCFDGFLDGPNIFYDANAILWKGITFFFQQIWPDIYSRAFVRLPFGILKKISADEEKAFFGPIGFLLIWPVIGWGLVSGLKNWRKSTVHRAILFLALVSIIFLLSQSFFGQFDPWRGRMFGTMILFAGPLCGIWFSIYNNNLLAKLFFASVLILSCWAAIWSILFREQSSWVKPNYIGKTLFEMSRTEQLMRDLPYESASYCQFDKLVPTNAKIISCLLGAYPEYVLFGEKLTRRVYTQAESVQAGIKADYLIFDSKYVDFTPTDADLGRGLFLRKLN